MEKALSPTSRDHGARDRVPDREHRLGGVVGVDRREVRRRCRSPSSTPSGFPVRFACEVNDFDPSDFIDQKAARRDGPLHPPRRRRGAPGTGGRATSMSPRSASAPGTAIGSALGGVRSFEQTVLQLTNSRAGPGQPVLDRADAPEPAGGLGLDRARHARAVARTEHGLCRLEHGDRRRPRCDPARPRRRDVLRRNRSTGDAGCARGLRRHARPVGAKRRPASRVAPVRRRPGRLRDRGGRGRARARGARARTGAWSKDLRRARGLRGLLRRQPRLRPRPDRRPRRARDPDGARRRRSSRRRTSAT